MTKNAVPYIKRNTNLQVVLKSKQTKILQIKNQPNSSIKSNSLWLSPRKIDVHYSKQINSSEMDTEYN